MGLDITLHYFLTKEESENLPRPKYSDDRNSIVSDLLHKQLTNMGMEHFIYKKMESFYDIEAYGITEDLKWSMTYYDKDGYPVHVLKDTTHELYPICEKICQINLFNKKISDVNEEDFFTDDELKLIKNVYGYTEPIFESLDSGSVTYHNFYKFICGKIEKEFHMANCPTYEKEVEVYYWSDEIGYQRKGLNHKFYDDFTEDDYFVLTKEKMQYIYDNYVDDDYKEHFKNELLDNFIEGKTYCVFDW